MQSLNILAIETSCDETASCVFNSSNGVLSNEIFSQIDIHKSFGGVIPEIASRSHLEKIDYIVDLALKNAFIDINDIDIIAVTYKPGLPGSLLIGLNFAKALSWSLNKKFIAVNHLEGHIFAPFIENHEIKFPALCITASGGHTSIYKVFDYGSYIKLGDTLDDSAGETFDKISKLINLGYPGGPIIEKLSKEVNFYDFFNYPRPMIKSKDMNFSFSGLKTAVLYHLIDMNAYDNEEKRFLFDDDLKLKQKIASSLLVAVSEIFEFKVKYYLKKDKDIKSILFTGGVASNNYIKNRLEYVAKKHNKSFYYPSNKYCTDNAAMIAFVANYKAKKNQYSSLDIDIM